MKPFIHHGPAREGSLTVAQWELLQPGDKLVALNVTACDTLKNGQTYELVQTSCHDRDVGCTVQVRQTNGKLTRHWCAGRFKLANDDTPTTGTLADELLKLFGQ